MNNTRLRFYFKILIFTLIFFMACGFETSFWPNIISLVPSPHIWLLIMIFISIRWSPVFSIFFIYFLGFCLTSFSDVPLKMIWSTTPIVFLSVWFIKSRIRLTGPLAFITLTLVGSTIFELSYYYISDALETIPATFMFFDRLMQILVNFVAAYPVYIFLSRVDTFIFDENDWIRSSKSPHEVINE